MRWGVDVEKVMLKKWGNVVGDDLAGVEANDVHRLTVPRSL